MTDYNHIETLKKQLIIEAERAYNDRPILQLLNDVFVPVILNNFAYRNPNITLIETGWEQRVGGRSIVNPIILQISKEQFLLKSSTENLPLILEIWSRKQECIVYTFNTRRAKT